MRFLGISEDREPFERLPILFLGEFRDLCCPHQPSVGVGRPWRDPPFSPDRLLGGGFPTRGEISTEVTVPSPGLSPPAVKGEGWAG